MAAEVTLGGETVRAGAPRELFTAGAMFTHNSFVADHRDRSGTRFLLPSAGEQSVAPISVVLNWPSGLKR